MVQVVSAGGSSVTVGVVRRRVQRVGARGSLRTRCMPSGAERARGATDTGAVTGGGHSLPGTARPAAGTPPRSASTPPRRSKASCRSSRSVARSHALRSRLTVSSSATSAALLCSRHLNACLSTRTAQRCCRNVVMATSGGTHPLIRVMSLHGPQLPANSTAYNRVALVWCPHRHSAHEVED